MGEEAPARAGASPLLDAEALWTDGRWEACIRMVDRVPADLSGDTPAERMAVGMKGAAQLLWGERTERVLGTRRRAVEEDARGGGGRRRPR